MANTELQLKRQDAGYNGSGSAISTQDKNNPIVGGEEKIVTPELFIRQINRASKDVGDWRSSLIAAESVYYPNSSRLYDLYEDLILDAFLSGIIRKRISQVVNKKLLLVNAQGEEVEEMKPIIKSKAFKNVMRQIVWTKFWGITGLEFIPGEKIEYNLIPRKHIKRKTQLITFEQFGLTEGIDYTTLDNVWVLGEPHDLGLLLICGFLTLLKKGAISDWAQYIEIFGSPAIVVKYNGYDQSAKVAAEKILEKVANSMRMTVPKEMDVTFEDGKVSNGDGKLQDIFRSAVNQELSIAILGNTETTSHGGSGGTGAKSKTHSEQQLEIIKDDMDDITDYLNSDKFMYILKSYGYPVDGCTFEFDREVDIDVLERKYPIDVALIGIGLPVTKKYLYETYAIPEPEPGDELLTPTQPKSSTSARPDLQSGPTTKNLTDLTDITQIIQTQIQAALKDFFA